MVDQHPTSEKSRPVTAARLRELLHYDPETGVFRWKVSNGGTGEPGRVAGCVSKALNRRLICVDQRLYPAYRLAWLYVHGEWPADQIDHINRHSLDDRINNLRPATNSENSRNKPAPSNNTSGVKGVSWDKQRQKWHAYINVNRKRKFLGYFANIEDARSAYDRAAPEMHGPFARLNMEN